MSKSHESPPSFTAARRFGIALNVLVSVVLLAAIVAGANYLGARHFRRLQWTGDSRFELSKQTVGLLDSLTNDVRVTMLFNREDSMFGPVQGLLKEYSNRCPRVRVEHVDFKRDLGRAQTIIARWQLPQTEGNIVLFETDNRVRVVRASELAEYDLPAVLAGAKEIKQVAFKGEPLFTLAIAGLLDFKPPCAYFLQGHGEHDPTSEETKFGYSKLAKLLEQKNIQVRTLRLTGENLVPDDCQMLVVAGPRTRYEAAELQKVNQYLATGGRMLALLSHYRSGMQATGFEKLMATWGVIPGDSYAFDEKNTILGNDIVCTNLSGPLSKRIQDGYLYLVLARPLWPQRAGVAGDAPRTVDVASTGEAGFTASEMTANGVPRMNPLQDRRGVIPLAVTVEKGNLDGVSADRGSTRIVAVGESVFLANETLMKGNNLDFANWAVNWLLDRPEKLAGIAPRPIRQYVINLTTAEMTRLRWILLGAFPGAVLMAGVLVWFRRRA